VARLGWLHLSDLHMGASGSGLLQPEYRGAFEQDLSRLHAKSGPWDVVLISGDLTASGHPREFELANSTLNSLWDYFRSLGSDPCLLAVPGTHDHRAPSLKGDLLQERYQAHEIRQALRQAGTNEVAQTVTEEFAPFTHWFNTWRAANPSLGLRDFHDGLLPGDFVATVVAQEMKVGIIGLNSFLWTSEKDGHASQREVTLQQVQAAMKMDIKGWVDRHEVLLLLTHEPPSNLAPKSLAELGMNLARPERLLLHLSGMRNSRRGTTVEYQSYPWFLALHAPSLLSGKKSELWGYNAGVVEGSSASGQLKVSSRVISSYKGVTVFRPGPEDSLASSGEVGLPRFSGHGVYAANLAGRVTRSNSKGLK
jgi:3',5'-cyclic AMP phosphodiesterase CpdA